jgi:hypothetical protein
MRKKVSFTAVGIAFRGFAASAAQIPTSSAPKKEKTALVKTFQKPRNFPALPAKSSVRIGGVEKGVEKLTRFERSKSTWVMPICKTSGRFRSTTCSEDQSENDKPQQDEDLDARQPEFKFSENSYAEVVDSDDCCEENRDVYSRT